MSYGQPDVYYQPEAFGLTIVGVAREPNLSWEFNMFAVWTDGKRLYWAHDSGCSCPSPFENYTSIESLNTGSKVELLNAFASWGAGSFGNATIDLAEKVRDWKKR